MGQAMGLVNLCRKHLHALLCRKHYPLRTVQFQSILCPGPGPITSRVKCRVPVCHCLSERIETKLRTSPKRLPKSAAGEISGGSRVGSIHHHTYQPTNQHMGFCSQVAICTTPATLASGQVHAHCRDSVRRLCLPSAGPPEVRTSVRSGRGDGTRCEAFHFEGPPPVLLAGSRSEPLGLSCFSS